MNRGSNRYKTGVAIVLLSSFASFADPKAVNENASLAKTNAVSRPPDDGKEYAAKEVKNLVSEWRKECGKRRKAALKQGLMYDAGGPDKVVVVEVVDTDGNAVSQATMTAYFYYEGEDGPQAPGIKADESGIIKYDCPGWFGPDRMDFYAVTAPGYKPRRVVKFAVRKIERPASPQAIGGLFLFGRNEGMNRMRRVEQIEEHRARIILEKQ